MLGLYSDTRLHRAVFTNPRNLVLIRENVPFFVEFCHLTDWKSFIIGTTEVGDTWRNAEYQAEHICYLWIFFEKVRISP